MSEPKYVTIMLVPDGTEPRSGWRVRRWVLKTVVISIVSILVGIVLFFSFYGKLVTRAAITERVTAENDDLRRYYYKVQILEGNLKQARELVTRMTEMAGIEYEFPELPDDSVLFADLEEPTEAVTDRPFTRDWTMPVGLPIQGFVTQEFTVDSTNHFHPGVDIAAAVGTPVLATGSGVVDHIAYDSVYGHVVILRHNDSVTSVYGHNNRILVTNGQEVQVGGRIALSGNSGKSTAPHLHYEVRIHDKPINPLDNPHDQEN
ncbi:MAG: M23 family metallopeptidase [candidate division Zixibacteria bacterium]|nr:M23 family metallopeptidase [candidate division Zixibacteria bacterium]